MIAASIADLPAAWTIEDVPRTPLPSTVLMSAPEYFDVRDVKNEFMRGNIGTVEHERAREQWEALVRTFEKCDVHVEVLQPRRECEDMVFTANPSFNGRRPDGRAICVPSRMRFASRQPEVTSHREWFAARGYDIEDLPDDVLRFEGGGDALWHPGRALIWAGIGARSEGRAHEVLAKLFDVPVMTLELTDPRLYHLDTCFCALNEATVLIYPRAFSDEGLALIRKVFADVIEVNEEEATRYFACNAAAFHGNVVMQTGAVRTKRELEKRAFSVIEVETGEFLKSGGSVFCMKAAVY